MAPPSRTDRVILALAIGGLVGWLSWASRPDLGGPYSTDFDHLWAAARVMLDGRDPYAAVGPAREIPWPYPLFYPLPALWLVAPLTRLPMALAQPVFVGGGAAVLAYLLSRSHPWRLLVFVSGAGYATGQLGQWSFWLTAAAMAPLPLGFLFAAKPSIGAAVWAYRMDRRALAAPAVLVLLSVIADPQWPAHWFEASRGGIHPMPVMQLGGPLILLALTRWRRPEARLLIALACIPQTIAPHETVPLFLVARSRWECLYLTAATWAVSLGVPLLKTAHTPPSFQTGGAQFIAETMAVTGPLFVAVFYLPCLLMVLRRPNESPAHSTSIP